MARSSAAKDLMITCVKGEGSFLKFWALPLHAIETVKNFEGRFSQIANELESLRGFVRSDQIPVGSKCAVKSTIKAKWCRARVLAHHGFINIFIQLMDYGNEEVISVADVRHVDDQLFSIPPQAVECILADVVPARGNEWSSDAVRFCEEHLVCHTLSCYVVSEYMKLPIVRVAKKGENEAFVQRLINSGLASIKRERVSPPPALSYKMNNMDQNTIHIVRVTSIESAHKFYVQLGAGGLELKHMMDSLNSYPAESLVMLKSPIVNTPCLAQLTTKPCYYRALITFVQQTRCKVFFVDYGYTELKEFQELRAIPPIFMNLSAQAICCSLPREVNLEPDEFHRLIDSELIECHVLSRTTELYVVKLMRNSQDIALVNQAFTQQRLNVGTTCDVTVSYVNDLTDFYVQLNHFKDHQNAISSILNSSYSFMPISLNECTPGKPVCTLYSEDNMWYRARIIKVNHESDIEVFFVDFGNYDHVNLRDIRRMSPELLKFPIQAFKCYLFETPIPVDPKAKDDAFDLFEELTNDQCLVAHIKAFTEESSYGITLMAQNSTASINEKLTSVVLSVPIVPINNVENIYVTSFNAADSFFAQLEKLDSEKLLQMQNEINSFYFTAQNMSFIPNEGNLVCAKFSNDEQFYRGTVEKCRNGFCDVFFLDYGNKESIPIKDIHPMDISFTAYPQFGIQCAFEKYPSGVPTDKLCNLILENSVQVKMVRKEKDKWYISLTENFPNNVAILELMRQHENVMPPRSIHGAGLGGYQEKPSAKISQGNISNSWQNVNNVTHSNSRNDTRSNFKDDYQKVDEPSTHLTPSKPEPVQEFDDYSLVSIPPNAYRNVYVSHVISPSEFYCQIEEDSPKLQLLMKNIEDAYAHVNDNLTFSKFAVDAPCCAVYEDGAWYRGKIKRVDTNACGVFFVDYGNTDTISNSKIKKLKTDLFRCPSQALQCKSYNISPKSNEWDDAEINAFLNMTLDKSFVAQFVECDKNGVYAVNLVSIGKIEHDIFNKEFVSLGYGRLEDYNKTLVLNSHAASNNLTYNLINVEVGSSEPVEVTYGLNPGEIFCQLKSYAKDFKQMMVQLQDYYNAISEAESLIDRPHQGMICVAQFHLDSAWYRAEIKKVESNKIIVLYVDYGNSETVDRKKARCIIQDYTLLPVQAVKCRIRGIKPPGKSWTVNNNLGKYFEGDAVCKFISKEEDSFLVDITCNRKDVAQLLVSDKLAVSDMPAPEIPFAAPKENKLPQTSAKLLERESSFVSGQLISVAVSFAESPAKFWCQLVDEADVLDQIMADIESEVQSSTAPLNTSSLNVGGYCLAQYYIDEAWYRAQIKSTRPEDTYEVFFVDYGNSEMVSVSQMKIIPSEFMELPPQCFECCLHNCPSGVTPEMTTIFRKTVEEAEEITAKVEKVSPGSCVVTLLYEKEDQEINISELLFGTMEVNESALGKEPPRFLPADVPLGLQEGFVSIANSPQDFYIQLAGTEDPLADLSAELADICESSTEENLSDICVGYACCAKYSEDNNWYRAEVTAIYDSTVDVLFVDYGNVDTVEKSSLKSLSDKHLEMQPLAMKCKLNGIVPITEEWSEEAINAFQEMVLDSCLGITFISKDIPAIVNIAKDDKEITQSLVDMELANFESCAETDEAYAEDHLAAPIEDPLSSLPNDQSYPERKLNSTKLSVKICYVDSYDKFYVMPLELSTELDTVMTTLELLYANKEDSNETAARSSNTSAIPDVLEDLKTTMPCVAKYSEDEAWYRAIITDIDGDNIYVTFVDYGNSEITSLKNLKPITPELVKIPPIAMESCLFGIEAITDQESEITAKLEEYFVDEVELEMEICGVNPYKIKLNHDGDLASTLISSGLAKEKLSTPVELSAVESFGDSSKLTFVDESLEYKIQISKRFFTDVDKIVGNIKFCELENDLAAFYVVSTDLEEELQALQQKLQDAYSEAPQNLTSVACMDFCATKYMEDENWYRAQVLTCDSEKIKVRFIDYGNCETVDRSDIFELLPDFIVEPQFSVKCILFGLTVGKKKEVELQNKLDEYVYHEAVELKLCKFSHAVGDLCITSVICGDVDLSEMILNEELVSQQYITNTQLYGKFKATVEKIIGDIVYIFPSQFASDREKFQSKLQDACKDLLSSEIKHDYLYAAKINDCWQRVSVVNISENDVTVHVVDFGSSEIIINESDLVPLPVDFCHQSLFLQKCTIEAFERSCTGENIGIQSLNVGANITCEITKTYTSGDPLKIKVLEIDLTKDEDRNDLEIIENVHNSVEETVAEQDTLANEIDVEDENLANETGVEDEKLTNETGVEDQKYSDQLTVGTTESESYVQIESDLPTNDINTQDINEVDNFEEQPGEDMTDIDSCVQYEDDKFFDAKDGRKEELHVGDIDSSVVHNEDDKDFDTESEDNPKELYIDNDVKLSDVLSEDKGKDENLEIMTIQSEDNMENKSVGDINYIDSSVLQHEDREAELETIDDTKESNDDNIFSSVTESKEVDFDTVDKSKEILDSDVYDIDSFKDKDMDFKAQHDSKEPLDSTINDSVKQQTEDTRDFNSSIIQCDEDEFFDIEDNLKESLADVNLSGVQFENNLNVDSICKDNQEGQLVSDMNDTFGMQLDDNEVNIEMKGNLEEKSVDVKAFEETDYDNLEENPDFNASDVDLSENKKVDLNTKNDLKEPVDYDTSNADLSGFQLDKEEIDFDNDDLEDKPDYVSDIDLSEDKKVDLDVKNDFNEPVDYDTSNADLSGFQSDKEIDIDSKYDLKEQLAAVVNVESSDPISDTSDIHIDSEDKEQLVTGVTFDSSESQSDEKEVDIEEKDDFKAQLITGVNNDSSESMFDKKDIDIDSKYIFQEQLVTGISVESSESQSNEDVNIKSKENLKEQVATDVSVDSSEIQSDKKEITLDSRDDFKKQLISDVNVDSSETQFEDKEDLKPEDFENLEECDGKNSGAIFNSHLLSGLVKVKVSDVAVSDGSVILAVHPLNLQNDFSKCKASMQAIYTKAVPFDENCDTNFCVVMHENEWCRSKILQKGNDSWTILLIDYGKCISVDGCDVKKLDDKHFNVPPFAVWCTLATASCSPEKCEDLKEFLCGELKDISVTVKILEGEEPYKVDLMIDNTSILHSLLNEGFVTQKLPVIYLEPGQYKAKLSFLSLDSNNPEMCVNLSIYSEDYRILTECMQNMYKKEDAAARVFESGIYSIFHNNSWCRCIALPITDQTDVVLVDTGETIEKCKDLCYLSPEHCLQPAYAIQCLLPFTSIPTDEIILQSIHKIFHSKEFLVDLDVRPESHAISATIIDELVLSELENLGLKCNSVAESQLSEEAEGNSGKDLCSKTAEIPEKESSEQIVGYLEETFTTEPL